MIAGPYGLISQSSYQRRDNLAALESAARAVYQKGHVPIVGLNLPFPIAFDLALPVWDQEANRIAREMVDRISNAAAERCDAVQRIGGPSKGADEEVQIITARGGVLYRSIEQIPDALAPA